MLKPLKNPSEIDASSVPYLATDQTKNGTNLQKFMLFGSIYEICKAYQNELKYLDEMLKRF